MEMFAGLIRSGEPRRGETTEIERASVLQVICLCVVVLFVIIPVASIFLEIPRGDRLPSVDGSTLAALRLSLVTSTTSLLLILLLGIPTARFLSRSRVSGKRLIDTVVDLPIVLPPAVAGLALLFAFAPKSPIGALLGGYGLILPGSIVAVVLAETFVAMPFFIRSARTAFEEVDPRLEMVASVLSQSAWFNFRKVVLPLASRGLVAGAILAWGRAMGEFGATLLFAGNLPGVTQTMPLAIYLDLGQNIYEASLVSGILIVISFAIIGGVRFLLGSRRIL